MTLGNAKLCRDANGTEIQNFLNKGCPGQICLGFELTSFQSFKEIMLKAPGFK